jgi:spore coat polysaccharide biosynthesis protein SpsF (cytidylyltransferase family)
MQKKYDLEHVTSYMRNKKRFKIGNLLSKENFSKLRWTLDEYNDYLFLRELNKKVNLVNASYNSIIRTLKKYPSLKDINSKINRNEGAKSWQRSKIMEKSKTNYSWWQHASLKKI